MVAKTQGNSKPDTSVVTTHEVTDEMLASVDNFEDAMRMFAPNEIQDSESLVSGGYTVLNNEEKSRLIDTPFLIQKYETHVSKTLNQPFTAIHVITKANEKFIVNDGSTGIHKQLDEIYKREGRVAPMMCRNGLRRSTYPYEDENGNVKQATTFYIA